MCQESFISFTAMSLSCWSLMSTESSIATSQLLLHVVNKDLDNLDLWLKGNKLSLNVVKTTSMTISTCQKYRKVIGDLDLKIRDTNIETVSETKYLGLQIDRHFTWKSHVNIVSKKVSRAI